MPGYEVYNATGTFVLRCRRVKDWKMVEIPEKEVRAYALEAAPKREDGTKSLAADFQLVTLTMEKYLEKLDTQEKTQMMPRADGSWETLAEWIAKKKVMNPTLPAGPIVGKKK